MDFIVMWAQGIIVAVIIATIIEMILPEGSNAKYIKVVIGIFILFNIISPIIDKFTSNNSNKMNLNFNVESSINETTATSITINNEETIRKMYEENLKIDIQTKVSQKGYMVGSVSLEILEDKNYTLNKIDIKVIGKVENDVNNKNNSNNVTTIVENIENIKIDIGGSRKDKSTEKVEPSVISESEKRKLKEYISGVYEVNENNIVIN